MWRNKEISMNYKAYCVLFCTRAHGASRYRGSKESEIVSDHKTDGRWWKKDLGHICSEKQTGKSSRIMKPWSDWPEEQSEGKLTPKVLPLVRPWRRNGSVNEEEALWVREAGCTKIQRWELCQGLNNERPSDFCLFGSIWVPESSRFYIWFNYYQAVWAA